jgi:hypothetical protein
MREKAKNILLLITNIDRTINFDEDEVYTKNEELNTTYNFLVDKYFIVTICSPKNH